MKPISLAILWHQHQPYYKKESEFILPWVRLHGVKDYVDLPLLIKEFPLEKQTINLVPSLMLQINEYIQFSTTDTIERLTRKFATELSQQEKREILRLFFLLIGPIDRSRLLIGSLPPNLLLLHKKMDVVSIGTRRSDEGDKHRMFRRKQTIRRE